MTQHAQSPLPFGVWFSRHKDSNRWSFLSWPLCLHCLSAFGSVVTQGCGHEALQRESLVSIAFRRLVQSSLGSVSPETHCRLARSPLPFGVWFSRHLGIFGRIHGIAQWSPLPFGVWFSRHPLAPSDPVLWRCESPLPFGVWFSRHVAEVLENMELMREIVSIAFRRLVQSSHKRRA